MVQFAFSKMNGLGNGFILMNDLDGAVSIQVDPARLAVAVCDRNFGIGADGLILVRKSTKDDYRMTIINADGSEAEMCGNGVRCFARFLVDEGITSSRQLKVETLAGTIATQVLENGQVRVDMGAPALRNADVVAPPGDLAIVRAEGHDFTFVSMGNPHAITFVNNFDFDWRAQGARVEADRSLFPKKTNVEFVQVTSPTEVTMKVWERGCGETMACGTGACALVVAGVEHNRLSQTPVTVHLPGGDLIIEYVRGNPVIMTGPAVPVCTGTYFFE